MRSDAEADAMRSFVNVEEMSDTVSGAVMVVKTLSPKRLAGQNVELDIITMSLNFLPEVRWCFRGI